MKAIVRSSCAVLAGSLLPLAAQATQGTFPHGYGVKSEGMGGVVLALPQDALVGASNPAGMVHVGSRLDAGLALLKVDNGTRFAGQTIKGTARRDLYVIPQFGWNHMLDEQQSVGISVVGNGVGTGYSKRSNIGGLEGAGSKFQQMVATLSYARKLNEQHSVGLGLMLIHQSLKVEGTASLGLPQGSDKAMGAGLRFGYQGQLTEQLSLGASFSTRGYMQKMNRFKNLLAERGGLDMPSTLGVGLGWRQGDWLFGADVQQIWWNQVRSLGNKGVSRAKGAPGSSNGPGFGWRNQQVYRLGMAWSATERLTLRAGYNRGNGILNNKDGYLALLAPSANHVHMTTGASYQLASGNELSFAYARSFKSKTRGRGQMPDSLSSPYMGQHWLSASYGVRF